jgi:Predicted AAA-ATPase/PD-(D/E)XK nuclease superfamily
MKTLPISLQTFKNVREGNHVYVDKTMFAYEIMNQVGSYFLTRPRRFGKSLFLSTLHELAVGNRALFAGLWIEDKWDWTRRFEVIHLDFSLMESNEADLNSALKRELLTYYKRYDLHPETDNLADLFKNLIAHIATINPIVLLIDEYDKPILQAIEEDNIEMAETHQKTMKAFYSVLKGSEHCFQSVFITGVTKLARVSIFSDLNHISDITFSPRFATAFGYTQTELEANFEDYFQAFLDKYNTYTYDSLIAKTKDSYNGYSFDGETSVYNPFGLLEFFKDLRFVNSWFQSGTPTFLIKRILNKTKFEYGGVRSNLNNLQFMSFYMDDPIPLMFQAGYLTIKEIDADNNVLLDYPNREVKESLYGYMMLYRDKGGSKMSAPMNQLGKAFHEENLQEIQDRLQDVFLKLPYDVYTDQRPREIERFYHGIIHVLLNYIGIFVESEVHTHKGRADAVVYAQTAIYIFEFKLGKTPQEALAQIKTMEYYKKFLGKGKKLYLIGANFDTKYREMEDLEYEVVFG